MDNKNAYYVMLVCSLSFFFVTETAHATWLEANVTDEHIKGNIPLRPQFKIVKDIVIEHPEDSNLATSFQSKHIKINHTAENQSEISNLIDTINGNLDEASSRSRVTEILLRYRINTIENQNSTVFRYYLFIIPTIENYTLTQQKHSEEPPKSADRVVDLQWISIPNMLRGLSIDIPTKYGRVDINKPYSILANAFPELSYMLDGSSEYQLQSITLLKNGLQIPALKEWHFMFDPHGSQVAEPNGTDSLSQQVKFMVGSKTRVYESNIELPINGSAPKAYTISSTNYNDSIEINIQGLYKPVYFDGKYYLESCKDLSCLSEYLKTDGAVRSPLEQFQFGIPVDEIACKNGLVLAIKFTDDSPACVKPNTKQELIKRGWAQG